MGAVTMRSLVLVATLFVTGIVAAPASAQTEPPPAAPAPAAVAAPDPAAAAPAAGAPAAAPPAGTTLTRDQIIDALARDKALEADFLRQLKERHARELLEITRQTHDDESRRIALNKRHVVLAYAAIWLLAVGFLIVLWRRQQAMNARIAQLKRELEAAVASNK
jgi:hypothetical protein